MSEFLQRFAERFAELNANNLERLAELYSDDILFRDPLHEVCGLAALQDYFAALYANVRELRFEFHGIEQCAEDAGYLRWRDGKVFQHRDYFDAGALLYEHLPVLGTLIGWLKRRLT